MVAATFGAISRGTEALVAAGKVPESEWERMRAPFQEGPFSFPVKYGYGTVGRIVAGDAARVGERVFCLYPHQDRFVVPEEMAVPVPEAVSDGRAVLAGNMETALNVIWDAAVLPGDTVAVLGTGASASAAAGVEARIVEASWYGDAEPAIPLGGAFHSRRLSIVASQVGTVPAARGRRWTNRRRLETALRLLSDPRLEALFSGETRFDDLAAHYADILADPATLCHRIRYD